MTIKALNINYTYQRLVQMMGVALLFLLGLYIYFVAAIIWDAAGREKTLVQAGEMSSQVSTLEAQYVTLSGKVTMELASNLGFAEENDKTGFALADTPFVAHNN